VKLLITLVLLHGILLAQAVPDPNVSTKLPRPNVPSDEVWVRATQQTTEGSVWKGRGMVEIRTNEIVLRADEIDYDRDKDYAEARGNVQFESFKSGEKLACDKVEYDLEKATGKFYKPKGSSPAKIDARPGLLVTSNPFYFEGDWAEKFRQTGKDGKEEDRYVLHNGFITDCKVPDPAWTLRGPKFDIIPGERAVAYNTLYRLRGIPLFYAPFFYKSLKRLPRRSGFLTPNAGNSSRRGAMVGAGYFWAINRSYDLMYRTQLFTTRGFAHTFDFRGRPNDRSDFNFNLYGVNDRGIKIGDQFRKQGGYLFTFNGKARLFKGFNAFSQINYLSKFEFRQAFTESFTEAIYAETHSTAYIEKHWSTYGFNIIYQRDQNFQSAEIGDTILIRKTPQFQFLSRDRALNSKGLPIYVSWDSTFGLLHRSQPQFQTRQYVDRADFTPRVSTAIHFAGFSLIPSFSARGSHYGSSLQNGKVSGDGFWRFTREAMAELVLPSLAKIGTAPKLFGGGQYKHVIESRASVRHAAGVEDFNKVIRFDSTELVANTTEVEYSLTNRLYTKNKDGNVKEVMSWELWQRRYLDPTFGGAVVPGRRNVLDSTVGLTPFSFLDGPRGYSPVVSTFRLQPNKIGVEWRTDYDPMRQHVVNSSLTADSRWDKYFVSVGHNQIRSSDALTPNSNQFRASFGIGNENRRGWNVGTLAFYDYRIQQLQYVSTQVTKNWDCCGVSVQYRRFNFGTRQENQFRVAFAIANIGSFGTLRRQERLF
jgi:LPS-assembly protein